MIPFQKRKTMLITSPNNMMKYTNSTQKNSQTMQNMVTLQPQHEIKFIYFAESPSSLLSQISEILQYE